MCVCISRTQYCSGTVIVVYPSNDMRPAGTILVDQVKRDSAILSVSGSVRKGVLKGYNHAKMSQWKEYPTQNNYRDRPITIRRGGSIDFCRGRFRINVHTRTRAGVRSIYLLCSRVHWYIHSCTWTTKLYFYFVKTKRTQVVVLVVSY